MTARFGALQPHSEAQKELQRLAQRHVQAQQRLAGVQLKAASLETAAELQLLLDACDSHARTGETSLGHNHKDKSGILAAGGAKHLAARMKDFSSIY